MVYGGVFKVLDMNLTKGNPRDPHTVCYYDSFCWGMVSKDAQVLISETDGRPKAVFGIRWKKHHFVNCTVFQDNPHTFTVAKHLRVGDMVMVCGRTKEWTYTVPRGKKGEGNERQMFETRAHIVIPMRVVASLMEVIKGEDAPEAIEGLEEYLAQMDGDEIPW